MTLSEGILIALIAGVFGLIGSIAATALQGWKWRTGEQPQKAAETVNTLTDTSLELVAALRTEVSSLRTEVQDVRSKNNELLEKLQEFEDVKDWAERLVHQVKSLGHEPVKMRAR